MSGVRIVNLSRRRFLTAAMGTSAGLTLGLYLPARLGRADGLATGADATTGAAESTFSANAFVRIESDDTVRVVIKHLEMGQGTYTGLSTLVAEELDARWDQIVAESAPADPSRYNNLFWGPSQGTGGSTAMANSFEQMRKAGAAARHMLVAAAAEVWEVSPEELTVAEGEILHAASGRSTGFGALVDVAARQAVPENPVLKTPDQFVHVGKRFPRKDHGKVDGTAIFTQDVKLDDMLTAVVAHPPRFGARLASFDASKATDVRGVVAVVEIPSGVAVLAEDFWSAKKGRDALETVWDESKAFDLGSAEIMARYEEQAKVPGLPARSEGEPDKAFDTAGKVLEANYEFPFLAHAAMEPMNCVVALREKGCEIWNGAQLHTGDQMAVAGVLGCEPMEVTIHTLYAGGSFGRRANPNSDYVVEAATIAKAVGGDRPVKLVWTREDDTRAGYFRPIYVHTLKAALDEEGRVSAWRQRIVGQSILAGTPFEQFLVKDGIDATSVEGAANLPYQIPGLSVELHTMDIDVPVQWWRAVGSTHTAFSTETFVDELAVAAGKDPVAFRLEMLKEHPRHAKVLGIAAEKGDWGKPLPPGKGRGVAVHESFSSYVAQVAEVSVQEDGSYSVDRVVCAVDCGIAVNPDVIEAQMEGGIGYGLSAVLLNEITLEEGRVVQSNFHDYPVLRINQMPEIEVHIVESSAPPTGVGEPGTPVIAPAVANALYAATGQRLRRLPLRLSS